MPQVWRWGEIPEAAEVVVTNSWPNSSGGGRVVGAVEVKSSLNRGLLAVVRLLLVAVVSVLARCLGGFTTIGAVEEATEAAEVSSWKDSLAIEVGDRSTLEVPGKIEKKVRGCRYMMQNDEF